DVLRRCAALSHRVVVTKESAGSRVDQMKSGTCGAMFALVRIKSFLGAGADAVSPSLHAKASVRAAVDKGNHQISPSRPTFRPTTEAFPACPLSCSGPNDTLT